LTHVGALSIAGTVGITGDFKVEGNMSVSSTNTLTTTTGDLTVTGTLTTGSGVATIGGALDVTGAASFGGNLDVTGEASFESTLTNTAEAAFTFGDATTVTGVLTPGAALTIAGEGAVTHTASLGDTSTNNVIIKNTEGVTLTAANTLAANLVATKATIVGDTTTGVTIDADATGAFTVPANAYITVPADGSIVAGASDNAITIAGAKLKPGTYTYTASGTKLSLGTTAEIEVDGGIEIAGAGDLELTLAATSVVFNENSYLDVQDATGSFGEGTQTNTKITVAGTLSKAKVEKDAAGDIWTVSADGTGTDISAAASNIVLGTLALDFVGTSAVTNDPCANADTAAAPGKLVTGTDTTITFIGT
jgi:hypothetical protein